MDERKTTIKELEEKKQADIEARKRLFEGLGEALLQRIGDTEPFAELGESKSGGILADYRKLQKEIADSLISIKSLEDDFAALKELEPKISAKEAEEAGVNKELEEVHVRLGRAYLEAQSSQEINDPLKPQEDRLLSKIEEQEKKLDELEDKEGGLITWLGKNAQMAVSKTILSRSLAALHKLYRGAGEKAITAGRGEELDGEIAARAVELNGLLASIGTELSLLRAERKKFFDSFGSESTPAKRIQGIEKQIARVKGEFAEVYLRLGYLAAEGGGREELSSFMREEDNSILEKAELLAGHIAEKDLGIKKIRTAMTIDDEQAEIEKMKKAILHQRQKIAAAEIVISGYENQIAESERHIEELRTFIQE